MIGKLTGIIDHIAGNQLILDVSGVGYIVYASGRTLSRIGTKGDTCSLYIETHVREDHIHLFGFADAVEQEWFLLLTKVQGVGAKAGLAILSVASPNDLSLAIAAQDKAVFTQADGVGPKLGTRIVTELKDKVGSMDISQLSSSPGENRPNSDKSSAGNDNINEALSALVNLGYGRSEAMIALNRAQKKMDENADLGSMIKQGLKELSA